MGARHHDACLGLATALLFLFTGLFAALPTEAAPLAPSPPTCQVTLAIHQYLAHPTSTVSDSVTFGGTVDVNLGSLSGSRSLSIAASSTVATWPASVAPATANVSTVEQVPFNATLVVPAMEGATTRGSLAVTASYLAVPGLPGTAVTCSDSVTISVAQYYGLTADTANPRLTLKTGPEGVVASIILHNLGNGKDTFSIDVEDRVGWDAVGIHAKGPTRVTLEANAETNATFPINATTDVKADVYELLATVRSEGQPQTVFTTVSLTLVVENTDILASLPDPSTLLILVAVAAGAVGAVMLRRRAKRRRAARQAREKLKQIVKQRREAEDSAEAPGVGEEELPPIEARPTPVAAERVRVRVKAPPRP